MSNYVIEAVGSAQEIERLVDAFRDGSREFVYQYASGDVSMDFGLEGPADGISTVFGVKIRFKNDTRSTVFMYPSWLKFRLGFNLDRLSLTRVVE